MKKLISRIIAFLKSIFSVSEIKIEKGIPEPKPSERSAEHKAYYNLLLKRLQKASKNKNKRYASTKGF